LKDLIERIAFLQKEIVELEIKSRQEYDELMKEIDDESNASESSSVVGNEGVRASSLNCSRPGMVSVGTETDPLSNEAWISLPTLAGPGDPDEIFGYVDDNQVSLPVPMCPPLGSPSI
jgi:hypothetical protein